MIGVDLIGEIRRAYFEQHRPIKEIVRTLSVSRATVRKVIRGQATEFKYERGVQPVPKLGEWVAVLTEILEQEAKLPRRERRSTQRLFEELRGRGYDGAHDSVHRFVRIWRDERARVPAQAFVPMSFAPGEAYQFDWSHETITLQGLPLMAAVLRGHYAYFGIPGNSTCLGRFRLQVMKTWRRVLLRRSQRPKLSWERLNAILKVYPMPTGHARDWRHQLA
jgi:transposase